MGKMTKDDVLARFITDLDQVHFKIRNNNAAKQDFALLNDYLKMVGISQEYIDDMYTKCGFSDIDDFISQSELPEIKQRGNVSCTLSKIEGTVEAVMYYLKRELRKMKSEKAFETH